MSDPLIGLVGVLVGLLLGSGFTFWSTRRAELARAVAACSVLSEELRTLRDEAASAAQLARVETAWADHRAALVCEMRPDDFTLLAGAVRRVVAPQAASPEDLHATFEALTELFWREHQALIVVPLVNYVRGNVLTKRVHDVLRPPAGQRSS